MWQVARGRLDVQAKCKTAMGKLRADLEKECVATLKASKSSKMIVFSRSSVKMHAQELIEWLVEEDLQAVAKGEVHAHIFYQGQRCLNDPPTPVHLPVPFTSSLGTHPPS